MHNSGTSLVASLLHAAGMPMGDRLLFRRTIPADRRPSYDYFEDGDVVALQDATLLALQRHWSSYRASFTLPDLQSTQRTLFREQLTGLLKQRFKRQQLWLVKDPRIGVLLDDWQTVLSAMELDLKLLIVHRDPGSNIRSFSSKGQVPELWAEALWQRTYTNALSTAKQLQAHQVAFTSFEALMTAPEQETRRLCDFLQWRTPSNLADGVKACFDPSLPTQAPEPITAHRLHNSTVQLEKQLNRAAVQAKPPQETDLLAHQIWAALSSPAEPLELNGLHVNGQSLQPKLGVTIVTAELQGWGPCGGIGSAYSELALALAGAGHPLKILLVAPGTQDPSPAWLGVEVQRLDPSGLERLELARLVAATLRDHRSDVVHLHDWLGLGSGLEAELGPHGPLLVVGLHGPSAWTRSGNPWPRTPDGGLAVDDAVLHGEGLIRALELDTIRHAGLLVSPSRFMAHWVQQYLLQGNAPAPLVVQRNCPLSDRLTAAGKITPDLQVATKKLVFFGRLEQRKGLLLFLDALTLMANPPEQVLFLGGDCTIGNGASGSELARARLTALGIPGHFEPGLQRDGALTLLQSVGGVVVIPSLIENSPCVVEELLDSGLRLVVTDVGGSKELVAEPCTPWLSAAHPQALAHHLDAALTLPDPQAYRLTARVPDWTIRLSWQAFHERLPRRSTNPTPTAAPPAVSSRGAALVRRVLNLPRRLLRAR